MAVLLGVGLVVVGGLMSMMTGALDVFTSILTMPDATTIAELERRARAAGGR